MKKLGNHKRSHSKSNKLNNYLKKNNRRKFTSISSLSQIASKTEKKRKGVSTAKSISKKIGRKLGMVVASKNRKSFASQGNSFEPKKKISDFRKKRLEKYLKNLSNTKLKKKDQEKYGLKGDTFSLIRSQNSTIDMKKLSRNQSMKRKKAVSKKSSLTASEKKTLDIKHLFSKHGSRKMSNAETRRLKEKYYDVKKENKMLRKTLKKAIALIRSSDMKHKVNFHFFNKIFFLKFFKDFLAGRSSWKSTKTSL